MKGSFGLTFLGLGLPGLCGADDASGIEVDPVQDVHVGLDGLDVLLGVVEQDIVPALVHFFRSLPYT